MRKVAKVNNFIYRTSYILIGIDIFKRTKADTASLIIFMGIFLLIGLNNHLRSNHFYKNDRKYITSMLLNILMVGILNYNINGYVDIFQFMILYELVLFTWGKTSKILIGIHLISMLYIKIFRNINVVDMVNLQFWQESLFDIIMLLLFIGFYGFSLFAYKALLVEKRKVEKLHKELNLSYEKLIEQSEAIEELAISKERNRLAGEIHDNLGHSLVALNMNLDVAEKIIGEDIDKTKELLNKSKDLSKESMESLRKAVYALKKVKTKPLKERLEEMLRNVQVTGTMNIILNMEEDLEKLSEEYKEALYSIIKEGLTNSIKHGKAEEISIDLDLKKDKIRLKIQDNGLGCDKIIKGNGLLGIEERVSKLGGSVIYSSVKDRGFGMEVSLNLE